MTEIRIDPLFAAFEFSSMDLARKAWRSLDGNPKVRNISAWAVTPPDRSTFVVVILGEQATRGWVDSAAEVIQACEGCVGNAILTKDSMEAFVQRRYGTLMDELAAQIAEGKTLEQMKAEGGLRQKATYGAGAKMRDGRIIEREDG